jgi:cytochrome P450
VPNARGLAGAAGALQTGRQMTEAEVKDNVMTFILGGQETTSSASTSSIRIG